MKDGRRRKEIKMRGKGNEGKKTRPDCVRVV